MRTLISVVVPVYCEEGNVRAFHEELTAATEDADFDLEMVFVDDGSTDRSLAELRALADADARVRVLSFSRNFGAYPAIAAGLEACRGDAAVVISADLQDPPALVVDLVAKWREGHDIVWGKRISRDDPFLKSLFARSFYWIIRRTTFSDFPAEGMDVALLSRRVVDIYNEIGERGSIPFFTMFTFGFDQAFVPYRRGERQHGTSGWSFWKRVRAAVDVMVTFSYTPIRFISVLGLLFGFAAFTYAGWIIYRKLILGLGGDGWSSTVVLILATSGIQMVLLGIVAEYLWRQGEYIRGRPRFIVMNEYGKEPSRRSVEGRASSDSMLAEENFSEKNLSDDGPGPRSEAR